jgi:hypothetical protein
MKPQRAVKTPKQYIANVPESRRDTIQTIHDAILAAVPEAKPFVFNGMLGYGRYRYKYASGREGEWFIVGLTNRKHHISLYICRCDKDGYVVEQNLDKLGNVSSGRSCVQFKNLESLNLKAALQLIKKAVKAAKMSGNLIS